MLWQAWRKRAAALASAGASAAWHQQNEQRTGNKSMAAAISWQRSGASRQHGRHRGVSKAYRKKRSSSSIAHQQRRHNQTLWRYQRQRVIVAHLSARAYHGISSGSSSKAAAAITKRKGESLAYQRNVAWRTYKPAKKNVRGFIARATLLSVARRVKHRVASSIKQRVWRANSSNNDKHSVTRA